MKKSIIFAFSLIVLSNCRKENPVKLPTNGILDGAPVELCNNNIKDSTELAIDCGGTCTPCVLSAPSCGVTLTNNMINMLSDFGFNANYNYSAVGAVSAMINSSNLLEVKTLVSNSYLFRFSVAEPVPFKAYNVTSNPVPAEGEVYVLYNNGGELFKGLEGQVHYNLVDNTKELSFCGVRVKNTGSSIFTITGKLKK